ncbi:extensin family protein [Notoacmeibacter ruber]|nr:extensin family protein [Notoacmeibacter ruber]
MAAIGGALLALSGCGDDSGRYSGAYGFAGGFGRTVDGYGAPAVMPREEAECRRKLKRMKVQYTDVAPIHDGPSCGIEWPVQLTRLPGKVAVEPAATLTCQMALATAVWAKEELNPSARWRFFSGVEKIRNGSSYRCTRIGGRGKWSAHASGNALDVMEIVLKNGKSIDVTKPGFFSFRQKGLLNAVREDACPYFTTVLGPGYDKAHGDHFHFDLMSRKNGYRVCK